MSAHLPSSRPEQDPGSESVDLSAETLSGESPRLQEPLLDRCRVLATDHMEREQLVEFAETMLSLLTANSDRDALQSALQLFSNAKEEIAGGLQDPDCRTACAALLGAVRCIDSAQPKEMELLQDYATDALLVELATGSAPQAAVTALSMPGSLQSKRLFQNTARRLVVLANDFTSPGNEPAAEVLVALWHSLDNSAAVSSEEMRTRLEDALPGCIRHLEEAGYGEQSPFNDLVWILHDATDGPDPALREALQAAIHDGYFPIATAVPTGSEHVPATCSLLVTSLCAQAYQNDSGHRDGMDALATIYQFNGKARQALRQALRSVPPALRTRILAYCKTGSNAEHSQLADEIEDEITFFRAQQLCPAYLSISQGDAHSIEIELQPLITHLNSLGSAEKRAVAEELLAGPLYRMIEDEDFRRVVTTNAVRDQLPSYIPFTGAGCIDSRALCENLHAKPGAEREQCVQEIMDSAWYRKINDREFNRLIKLLDTGLPDGLRLLPNGSIDLEHVEEYVRSLSPRETFKFSWSVLQLEFLSREEQNEIHAHCSLASIRDRVPDLVTLGFDGTVDVHNFALQYESASVSKKIQLLKTVTAGAWISGISDARFVRYLSECCVEHFHRELGLCSVFYPKTPAPDIWKHLFHTSTRSPGLSDAVVEPMHDFLNAHGLNGDEYCSVDDNTGTPRGWWVDNSKPEHYQRVIAQSIACIQQLDAWEPGTARLLRERCGIRVFGRYSPELLFNQALLVRDPTLLQNVPESAVFVTFPLSDWNGAFYGDPITIEAQAESRRRNGLWFVFSEADTSRGVLKQLLRHRNQFGPLRYVVLGGHGDSAGITLADHSNLLAKEIEDPLVGRLLREIFADGGQFVLRTCEGGLPEGIAHKTSRQLAGKDVTIYSSDAVSYVESFTVRHSKKKPPTLSVHFSASKQIGTPLYDTTVRHADRENR